MRRNIMSNSISQDFKLYSLLKFALPSMVMMVFMSLYTIIDGIFVSRFVGSEALSAINIVFPVLNVLIAVGIHCVRQICDHFRRSIKTTVF